MDTMFLEVTTDFATQTTASGVTAFGVPSTYSLPAVACNVAVGLIICALNGLCFLAIIHQGLHKEEIKFIFMAAYAAVDSTIGLVITAQNLILNWDAVSHVEFTKHACYAVSAVIEVAVKADGVCLLLLTLHQFLRIKLHIKYPLYATKKKAYIGLGLAALFPTINLIVLCILWDRSAKGCLSYVAMSIWLQLYNQLVMFGIPLLAMAAMHGYIFYIARRQLSTGVSSNLQASNNPGSSSSSSIKKHWKAVVTLTVLVGILICTWAPANILSLLFWANIIVSAPQYVVEIAIFVYYLNYLLNPIVYIFRVPEVRQAVSNMLFRSHS